MTDDSASDSRIDYAARRHERAAVKRSTRFRSVPLWTAAAVIGLLVLAVAGEALATAGRVHPGVRIAGIEIGGMKPGSARSVLETSLPAKVEEPVVVRHGDKSWQVSAADIGLGFDYDAMVDAAMAVGREGGFSSIVFDRLDAWFGGRTVEALPTSEKVRTQATLDRIAEATDLDPVDASVNVSGVDVEVIPGADGVALDHDGCAREVLAAMLEEDRTVTAPTKPVAMDVTAEEAQAAAAIARRMLQGPAVITYKGESWTFQPDVIAKTIVFRRSDEIAAEGPASETTAAIIPRSSEVTLVALVSTKGVSKEILPEIGVKIGRPAKDATFKVSSGRVSIVSSRDGVGPDVEALAADLAAALTSETGERTAELKTTSASPKISTQDAQKMGIKERIARYTTTFSSGNQPRVANIRLLGKTLDGQLIAPGETFSFNKRVGERTAAKGYREAGAIVDGRIVNQLGGGICQVGTTLFNTVFESGLPVIERRNHSFYISTYPKGRDATVSWGGPDLKFKNDTENWLLIAVAASNSSITISLYGTDAGYSVESQTGKWANTKRFDVEEIKDPTMYKGTQSIEDAGVTGRSITVKRIVYRDGEVVRTDDFVSRYRPKTQVVRVGTKPLEKKSKTPTSTP